MPAATVRRVATPGRSDVGVMLLFLAPSVAQVLLDPIASRPLGLVFAAGSVVPLAWRRTAPTVAVLAGSGTWLLPTDGYLYLGYAVAVMLFFSAGAYIGSVQRLGGVTAWGLAMGTAGVLRGPERPIALLTAWLVVVASVLAGRLVAQQREQMQRLQERTEHLERERALTRRSAVAEERSRIARELHDVVGHEVTLIAIQSEAAASALRTAPERATGPVEAIRETAHRAAAEMRAILGVLRQSDDDPVLPHEQTAIEEVAARARRMGMDVTVTVTGEPWHDRPNVWLAVHRIVQEALTNARRHAPGSPVTVAVSWTADAVEVLVSNPCADGTTAAGDSPTAVPGFGILGMTERARLLGGRLTAGRDGAGRFEVAARLPSGQNGGAA